MFFIGSGLLETILLIANAMAIINEEWILKKCIFNKMVGINQISNKKKEFSNLSHKLLYYYILWGIMEDIFL